MSETFGTRLRLARERRQIELADIAARTKIKASLFDELERDDPSHWPAGIFRRSFIRAYAGAIGLDPDATMREFLERFPDPADPPPVEAAPDAGRVERPAVAVAPTAPAPPAASHRTVHHLRLTLVETGLPFTGGRFLADAQRRWSAAAWDLGSLIAIALMAFVVVGRFWMPFAVTALCYYVGGILLLGNTPGVCLFAPRPNEDGTGGPRPARVPRHRPPEPAPVRHAEPAFRAVRYRKDRRSLEA